MAPIVQHRRSRRLDLPRPIGPGHRSNLTQHEWVGALRDGADRLRCPVKRSCYCMENVGPDLLLLPSFSGLIRRYGGCRGQARQLQACRVDPPIKSGHNHNRSGIVALGPLHRCGIDAGPEPPPSAGPALPRAGTASALGPAPRSRGHAPRRGRRLSKLKGREAPDTG
jgi:hypothetical protein